MRLCELQDAAWALASCPRGGWCPELELEPPAGPWPSQISRLLPSGAAPGGYPVTSKSGLHFIWLSDLLSTAQSLSFSLWLEVKLPKQTAASLSPTASCCLGAAGPCCTLPSDFWTSRRAGRHRQVELMRQDARVRCPAASVLGGAWP